MKDEDEVWSYLQDIERGARFEGEAKGRAEGRKEGEAKGRAEERAELQENVVLNCRRAGLPVETISAITGLTPKQINEILK